MADLVVHFEIHASDSPVMSDGRVAMGAGAEA